MSQQSDTFRTLNAEVIDVVYKEKGSKFIGYAFEVRNPEQIRQHLERIKKLHHSARHWCYAWQIGAETKQYRANDDGEPSGTAGLPIFGQIQSFDLTNVLVIVVRYFGGIKLGVGGLVTAYKTTTQMTLSEAEIRVETIKKRFEIAFDYPQMNAVMRVVKEKNAEIISQDFGLSCKLLVQIRRAEAEPFLETFRAMYPVRIKMLAETD